MTKVAPAIPGLRDELGLTLVESGLIATMFNLMGMLVGMLAGVLCDRFGHKRLALGGARLILCAAARWARRRRVRQPAPLPLSGGRRLHRLHRRRA